MSDGNDTTQIKNIKWSIGVTTASSRGEDLKGRITLHFSVELSNGEKLDMDLPPEEFYKFCLEVEKGKQQLQLLTTTNSAQ